VKRHNVVTGILIMVITLVFVIVNLTSCGPSRPADRYRYEYQESQIPVEVYRRQDGYILKVVTFEGHRYIVGNTNGSTYTHLKSCCNDSRH